MYISDETKERLLDEFKTQTAIAAFVSREPATVSQWLCNRHPIPVAIAKLLSAHTGISFFDLRLDIPRGGHD